MRSWRYFVVWMCSSVMKIVIWFVRKVERRGYGNELAAEVELVWWNEEIRFERRIFVVFVMYVFSSSLVVCDFGVV